MQPILHRIRNLFDAKPVLVELPLVAPGMHPTAVLNGEIELEDGATVGPYCVIEGRVKVGRNSQILAHTTVQGTTFIGANCKLGPHAAIGTDPQHRGYDGSETYLVIEDDVIVREFASLHRATRPGLENATRVGRGTMVMATAHVGHDCRVGENATLANGVMLGGHVTVGDGAFLGGNVGVHQFCRVGRMAIVGGGETLTKDVVPFAAFRDGGHRAYNAVGVRRAGWPAAAVRSLRSAFHRLHHARTFVRGAEAIRADEDYDALTAQVREIVEFIAGTRRGIHASAGHADVGERTDAPA